MLEQVIMKQWPRNGRLGVANKRGWNAWHFTSIHFDNYSRRILIIDSIKLGCTIFLAACLSCTDTWTNLIKDTSLPRRGMLWKCLRNVSCLEGAHWMKLEVDWQRGKIELATNYQPNMRTKTDDIFMFLTS